jgi:hypothetical protein
MKRNCTAAHRQNIDRSCSDLYAGKCGDADAKMTRGRIEDVAGGQPSEVTGLTRRGDLACA